MDKKGFTIIVMLINTLMWVISLIITKGKLPLLWLGFFIALVFLITIKFLSGKD